MKFQTLRKDFPAIIDYQPNIYVDNAATTQIPRSVIAAVQTWYEQQHANVYRGLYDRAEAATMLVEKTRASVASWIGAHPEEVVFTHGATEGINMVALGWAAHRLRPDDEIVITELEHHANSLPWYEVARRTGAVVKQIPVAGMSLQLNLDDLDTIITPKTRLVALTKSSNLCGLIDPEIFSQIHARARAVGAAILVDAAQYMAHHQLSLATERPDFLVFSGHKMFAPTGVGILYVAQERHAEMQPVYVGGGMVSEALQSPATWLPVPRMLEAGTPSLAALVGLGATVAYLRSQSFYDGLQAHEAALTGCVLAALEKIPGVSILGDADALRRQGHMVTFTVEDIHAHDIAAACADRGVAVRAGHHCCQALHARLGIASSVRVSFAAYNTEEEAVRVGEVIAEALALLRAV